MACAWPPPMENPAGPALSNGRVKRGSDEGVTPNESWASESGVRPFIGMTAICDSPITCPTEAEAVCSIWTSAETVMDSVWLPN